MKTRDIMAVKLEMLHKIVDELHKCTLGTPEYKTLKCLHYTLINELDALRMQVEQEERASSSRNNLSTKYLMELQEAILKVLDFINKERGFDLKIDSILAANDELRIEFRISDKSGEFNINMDRYIRNEMIVNGISVKAFTSYNDRYFTMISELLKTLSMVKDFEICWLNEWQFCIYIYC